MRLTYPLAPAVRHLESDFRSYLQSWFMPLSSGIWSWEWKSLISSCLNHSLGFSRFSIETWRVSHYEPRLSHLKSLSRGQSMKWKGKWCRRCRRVLSALPAIREARQRSLVLHWILAFTSLLHLGYLSSGHILDFLEFTVDLTAGAGSICDSIHINARAIHVSVLLDASERSMLAIDVCDLWTAGRKVKGKVQLRDQRWICFNLLVPWDANPFQFLLFSWSIPRVKKMIAES